MVRYQQPDIIARNRAYGRLYCPPSSSATSRQITIVSHPDPWQWRTAGLCPSWQSFGRLHVRTREVAIEFYLAIGLTRQMTPTTLQESKTSVSSEVHVCDRMEYSHHGPWLLPSKDRRSTIQGSRRGWWSGHLFLLPAAGMGAIARATTSAAGPPQDVRCLSFSAKTWYGTWDILAGYAGR